jgi:transcriptional regulator of arginine metabolism
MRMHYSKEQRQRAIAELIRANPISSQEEVAERLLEKGYTATQATISRDLDQIGAVKVRRGGRLSYSLPDRVRDSAAPSVDTILHQWVRSIDVAMNTIVMKTPPGSAHLIGVALDQSQHPQIVGTICGDDTIFVACRSTADAEGLAAKFGGIVSLP